MIGNVYLMEFLPESVNLQYGTVAKHETTRIALERIGHISSNSVAKRRRIGGHVYKACWRFFLAIQIIQRFQVDSHSLTASEQFQNKCDFSARYEESDRKTTRNVDMLCSCSGRFAIPALQKCDELYCLRDSRPSIRIASTLGAGAVQVRRGACSAMT